MNRYARTILDAFGEAYPGSAQFCGGRRLRLGTWEKRIPEIVHDVEAKNQFLSAAEALEKKKVVELKWRRFRTGTDLEAIVLEAPVLLYELLGRDSPETIRRQMLEVLRADIRPIDDPSTGPIVDSITEFLVRELTGGRKVAISSADDMRALLTLLTTRADLVHTLPLRALSVRLFGDSKRLEGLFPAFDAVFQKAVGEKLSDVLGLSRSYPEVSVSLFGTILVDDSGRRRWNCNGEILTLPLSTVEGLGGAKFVASVAERCLSFTRNRKRRETSDVITVENKESFYTFSKHVSRARSTGRDELDENDLRSVDAVVYTAGHPNPAVIAILRLLIDAGARIRHFGDMDPDGLLIPAEISRLTRVGVTPFLMDVDLYRRFLPYGYTLGDGAIERLRTRRDDLPAAFLPLSEAILEQGIGVEQEVLDPREI
jgi:hypothetical protein